jgi:hypothetical protein
MKALLSAIEYHHARRPSSGRLLDLDRQTGV